MGGQNVLDWTEAWCNISYHLNFYNKGLLAPHPTSKPEYNTLSTAYSTHSQAPYYSWRMSPSAVWRRTMLRWQGPLSQNECIIKRPLIWHLSVLKINDTQVYIWRIQLPSWHNHISATEQAVICQQAAHHLLNCTSRETKQCYSFSTWISLIYSWA
jgi:hypothetical protein